MWDMWDAKMDFKPQQLGVVATRNADLARTRLDLIFQRECGFNQQT